MGHFPISPFCTHFLSYNDDAFLFCSELSGLIGLAHFLKLVSIPAVVVEKKWTHRFPNKAGPSHSGCDQKDVQSQKLAKTLPKLLSKRKRKIPEAAKSAEPEQESKPILSTTMTRSGRRIVPKRYTDSILGGPEDVLDELEVDEPDYVVPERLLKGGEPEKREPSKVVRSTDEKVVDPASSKKEVRVVIAQNDGTIANTSTAVLTGANSEQPSNESEIVVDDSIRVKLDDLFSVAEAIEKSQQPEFHDVSSAVVPLEGTDTQKLVRECFICKKQMLGRNALSRHLKNTHPKVFGPYNCPIETCGKVVESGEKMLAHMQQQHKSQRAQAIAAGERFHCDQCSIVYTTKSRLNFHLRTKHGRKVGKFSPSYACTSGGGECKEVFFTAKQFSDHMKNVHNLKPWGCKDCDKRFADKQNLQFHELTHKGTKSFVCDICNAAFGNPRQLFTHRALHLGRRFLCADCGYRARSAANLRGHVKTKHEGKGFECTLCHKRFSSNNNLKNHASYFFRFFRS